MVIDYAYDANGNPFKITVTNGSTSYYGYFLLNQQGDVIAIVDANGTAAVKYTYDAWGKIISKTTAGANGANLARYNAIGYRGYYYDADLGMYYLQSRYYDPAICRFINADGQLSVSNLSDANLFTYCGNNPVNNADATGNCYYDAKGNWCHDAWEYMGGSFTSYTPVKLPSSKKQHSSSTVSTVAKNAGIAIVDSVAGQQITLASASLYSVSRSVNASTSARALSALTKAAGQFGVLSLALYAAGIIDDINTYAGWDMAQAIMWDTSAVLGSVILAAALAAYMPFTGVVVASVIVASVSGIVVAEMKDAYLTKRRKE